jgi:hypothetical protein
VDDDLDEEPTPAKLRLFRDKRSISRRLGGLHAVADHAK